MTVIELYLRKNDDCQASINFSSSYKATETLKGVHIEAHRYCVNQKR